jgi:hypothetical protein
MNEQLRIFRVCGYEGLYVVRVVGIELRLNDQFRIWEGVVI